MKTPGERLAWAREQAGYETAADAARALNCKYPTYAGHENTSRGLSAKVAARYAAFFRVSLAWLLTGTGSPKDGVLISEDEALAVLEVALADAPLSPGEKLDFRQRFRDRWRSGADTQPATGAVSLAKGKESKVGRA